MGMSQQGMAIKSIQRGVITLTGVASATATITAVDTSKTELRFCGVKDVHDNANTHGVAHVALTNSTTITAMGWNVPNSIFVSWELTEFF